MTITVLGVPDSAGAYCVGVERAPSALRGAGLLDALAAAGNTVHDAGDLTERQWAPDREHPRAQNLRDEVEAVVELADAAGHLLADGSKLLVLGGSCTVALGMLAAQSRRQERPRIIYLDRHLDLNTPESTTEGSLSWMGMAHALALAGTCRELADATHRAPLLEPADLVYLGVEETQATPWEREQVRMLDLAVVSQAELCAHPATAARTAWEKLGPGPFVLHLDVDVLDFLDAPIAENVNGRNSGPSIDQLEEVLGELWHLDDCRGMSIGQLDPAHARADPTALPRFIGALASAMAVTVPADTGSGF